MCIFSGRVNDVGSTKIFARLTSPGFQALIYQMEYETRDPVAMILPIPTPPVAAEDSVRFYDFSSAPDFFDHLEKIFPPIKIKSMSRGLMKSAGPPLKVHQMGSFIASFAPRLADMDRLDPQFKLPLELWRQMPYDNFGFAVVQLKPGADKVHPIAFTFPTRLEDAIFYPTKHVHDAQNVPDKAFFDHVLYGQDCFLPEGVGGNFHSVSFKEKMMKFDAVVNHQELVSRNDYVGRLQLENLRSNIDTVLRRNSEIPVH